MRELRCFSDVRGLRTLLTLSDLELDLITFLKTLVAFRGDRAVVHEHVRAAIIASDKAVALGVVKPLDRTFQTFHVRPPGTFSCDASPYPAIEAIVLLEKGTVKGLQYRKGPIGAA